jgi:hypothetical protein
MEDYTVALTLNRYIGLALLLGLSACSSAPQKTDKKMPEEKIIAEDKNGEINAQVIRERLVQEQSKLGECYSELKIPYGSKEEVLAQVEFNIVPVTGSVTEVLVQKTTHITLGQCLDRILKQTNFMGVVGEAPIRVKQTFNFTAE